eukprot:758473-Hanusia_phi.AAC.3
MRSSPVARSWFSPLVTPSRYKADMEYAVMRHSRARTWRERSTKKHKSTRKQRTRPAASESC